MSYTKSLEIRWSDLDPNFHVRHSVYYDFGAFVRMSCLTDFGLGTEVLLQQQLGPVLFREECVFKRELQFRDIVSINLVLTQSTSTFSRWTMQHQIIKNEGIVSAIITVDGAWMDISKRKLTVPPDFVIPAMQKIPKATDFKIIDRKA